MPGRGCERVTLCSPVSSVVNEIWVGKPDAADAPEGCASNSPCDSLVNCPGHLAGIRGISLREGASFLRIAGVAQSVEHLICNQGVGGSNPFASSRVEAVYRRESER